MRPAAFAHLIGPQAPPYRAQEERENEESTASQPAKKKKRVRPGSGTILYYPRQTRQLTHTHPPEACV